MFGSFIDKKNLGSISGEQIGFIHSYLKTISMAASFDRIPHTLEGIAVKIRAKSALYHIHLSIGSLMWNACCKWLGQKCG